MAMSYYRFDTLSDEESDGIELEFGESCVEPKISPYVSSRANGDNPVEMGQNIMKDEDLRMAIQVNNVVEVQRILSEGVCVDKVLIGGWTPLMLACDYGLDDMVKLLLKEGANPNTQIDTFSALMAVCCSRCDEEEKLVKCALFLLEYGAMVNSHDRHGMLPLMYACQHGHLKLVHLLVSKGADVTHQDVRGWTPLMFAAAIGSLEIIKILLQAGADPNVLTVSGETASVLAESNGHYGVVDLLEGRHKSDASVVLPTHPLLKKHQTSEAHPARPSTNVGDSTHIFAEHAEECIQYGDLEMFLLGLQLGDLLPLFKEHQVTFSTLLCMTEEDLEQVGISQVGLRKKIFRGIVSIHKKEWSMPNHSTFLGDVLSSAEAVVILSHLSKHIQYVRSTTSYLLASARKNGDMLDSRMEQVQSERLVNEMQNTVEAVEALQQDIYHLHTEVISSLGASRITRHNTSRSRCVQMLVPLFMFGALAGCGLLFWSKLKK